MSKMRCGAVDRERIVGTWQCRDLNPYPDQIDQLVRETYDADGSYHAGCARHRGRRWALSW